MSKNTLAAFRNFSASLLPHQIFWIENIHQLTDPEKIPNSQMHIIPRSGHFVQFESYEQFNQLVIDFLK